MPNKPIIQPISEQEKEQILARHHELVDKMNTTLGGALKYQDEAILARLSDPKEVALYRSAQALKEENEIRMRKFQELQNRFGANQIQNNPMSRTIVFCLKAEDTLAAKRFNEKIYQDYITNPNRVVYYEYSKILNFNPKELHDCQDDPTKLVELYRKYPDICENAFNIYDAFGKADVDSKVTDSLKSMKKVVEGLNDPANAMKKAVGIDFFATPELTEEQALQIVMGGNETMRDPTESLMLIVNGKLPKEPDNLTGYENLERFRRIGINIDDPHFYVQYKAVETDPSTRRQVQVSFDKYFRQNNHNSNDIHLDVDLQMRNANELFSLKCITNEAKREYCSEFERRMALQIGQINYNVAEIENRNKGGIWERYIRRSTSREYKEFIAALKDYNNPESPNYLDKGHLRGKTIDYLVHKANQGYRGLGDMKGTSLSRTTLAMNVIQVIDGMEKDEDAIFNNIEQKLVGSYHESAVSAVKAEQVNLEGPKVQAQKEKVVEVEKSVENENEINTISK